MFANYKQMLENQQKSIHMSTKRAINNTRPTKTANLRRASGR